MVLQLFSMFVCTKSCTVFTSATANSIKMALMQRPHVYVDAHYQACCNMLGRHWRRIDERAWSAMLVTLLEELKVGPTHAWAKVGMASLSDDVMKLVSVFNTEELLSSQGYILVHHPDILEAVRVRLGHLLYRSHLQHVQCSP